MRYIKLLILILILSNESWGVTNNKLDWKTKLNHTWNGITGKTHNDLENMFKRDQDVRSQNSALLREKDKLENELNACSSKLKSHYSKQEVADHFQRMEHLESIGMNVADDARRSPRALKESVEGHLHSGTFHNFPTQQKRKAVLNMGDNAINPAWSDEQKVQARAHLDQIKKDHDHYENVVQQLEKDHGISR